jgi:thymidine phosphorylase
VDIVQEQGGNTDYLHHPASYPSCKHIVDVPAPAEGWITAMDSYEIGMTAVELGAGRIRKEDTIDPCAGIEFLHKVGSKVAKNETIARIHTNNSKITEASVQRLQHAVSIGSQQPAPIRMITHRVDRNGVTPV